VDVWFPNHFILSDTFLHIHQYMVWLDPNLQVRQIVLFAGPSILSVCWLKIRSGMTIIMCRLPLPFHPVLMQIRILFENNIEHQKYAGSLDLYSFWFECLKTGSAIIGMLIGFTVSISYMLPVYTMFKTPVLSAYFSCGNTVSPSWTECSLPDGVFNVTYFVTNIYRYLIDWK